MAAVKFTGGRRWVSALVVLGVMGVSTVAFAAPGDTAAAEPKGNILFAALDYSVLALLGAASVAGVALIIDAIMHIRESRIAPVESTEHVRSLINSRQFKELMDFTATDESFVSKSLNAGLRRAHLGYPAMREAMENTAGEETANVFRRIELLNVIGNIGPLLGLLGTVLGMIMAFKALGDSGGAAKVDKLAPGISAALFHTFFGLAVAIPCLVSYGFYRTRIDKMTAKATTLTEELLESLRPAEGKAEPAARPAAAAAPAARPAPRRVAAPTPRTEEE